MKKSVEKKETVIQLSKDQIKRLPESHSSYTRENEDARKKFRDIQPGKDENIEFEILNFGYDNSDTFTDLESLYFSEASTSKEFNMKNTDFSTSDSQKTRAFIPQNTKQLQYMVKKKEDDLQNISCSTFRVNTTSDFNFQYPVERIKLSNEGKSIEDIESPLNINFSETFQFKNPSFVNLEMEGFSQHEEKLFRFDSTIKEPDDMQNMSPELRKILKKKMSRCDRFPKHHKKSRHSEEKTTKERRKVKKEKEARRTKREIKIPEKRERRCYIRSGLIVTPEEDLEIKRQLLDFFFYLIFLSIFTAIALCMVSSNMFYFTKITTSMFFDTIGSSAFNNSSNDTSNENGNENVNASTKLKTLRESRTLEDFWAFAETTLLDLLYWNFYYSRLDPEFHTAEDDRKMLYGNQILGVARMRQVRVRSDSCEIHPNVRRFFNECYYYYSVFSEETDPIKEDMVNASTATAWVYTESSQLGSSNYWGEVSVYGGGGYYLDLGENQENASEMIRELKENYWISRATRAVFIDFNLYNANANLFCICKIVLEFPPVGGIIPVADFHSLKLIRYLNVLDFFILGLEFLFLIFVFYYTWQTIRNLHRQKLSFFLIFWNYFDVIILILSYIYIILSILRYFSSTYLISKLSDRTDQYTEFDYVKNLQIQYNNTIAVLLFFCWVKLFKYFTFNTVLLEFKITLARSIKDILGFFPMFLTMFLAFAFLAYLLFGNQVKTYNTLWLSFLTLLQAFLGEFYYTEIVESNRILGPIFYIAYIFFIFFVLLNVFIAIINDAYTSVKAQVLYEKPRTGEYMKRGLLNIVTCGRHTSKKQRLREARKQLLFQEIQNTLKKAGFSEAEINLFFYKYNINVSNFLEENTKKRVLQDLELKRIDFSETSEQVQINALRKRLDVLTSKMEDLDTHLQPVIDKVDVLLRSSRK